MVHTHWRLVHPSEELIRIILSTIFSTIGEVDSFSICFSPLHCQKNKALKKKNKNSKEQWSFRTHTRVVDV